MAEECKDEPKERVEASPIDANKNTPGNSCAHPTFVGRRSSVAEIDVMAAVRRLKQVAGLRKNTEKRPKAG